MPIKTSDVSVQSDNTVNDDSQLRFMVSANEWVFGHAVIFITSGTTPDFRYNFSVPVGATGTRFDAALSAVVMSVTATLVTEETAIATTGAKQAIFIPFSLLVGSTAGEVIFRWAQNTSTASNTTVHAGSYIKVWRV